MSVRPHKVATTFYDTFLYVDASGNGVTGKVQADFTIEIEKQGTGGQATTGVTITEVNASTNPGLYAITISGATGFILATGVYSLVIYDTAAKSYRWELTVVVTANGDFDGTFGVASFTSSSGNGRVTDGAAGLVGALVYIRDSAGNLYTSTSTNASGDWGPVFFPASGGTYTVYAQASGYSAASGVLLVGVATVTGPGVNIALAGVSSGSGSTLSELMGYARRVARDPSGSKGDADLKSAINDALLMASRCKRWEWFKTKGQLSLAAYYSAGTVDVTTNTAIVTLTGGTFPSWAALGSITLNGVICPVVTRDGDTQLTLANAWNDATITAGAYQLFQDEYELPADLINMGSIFPGQSWGWPVTPTSFDAILQLRANYNTSSTNPTGWAIYRNKILVWPYPQTSHLLNFWYYRRPALLMNASDEADWDDDQMELLQRAIDYQVSIRWSNCVAGTPERCLERYKFSIGLNTPYDKAPAVWQSPVSPRMNNGSRGSRRTTGA